LAADAVERRSGKKASQNFPPTPFLVIRWGVREGKRVKKTIKKKNRGDRKAATKRKKKTPTLGI